MDNSFVSVSLTPLSPCSRLIPADTLQTSPSLVPDFKAVTVRTADDTIVNVELWDFPGIVAGENRGPLLTTFFHAAIICFSLENKDNLANLSEVVSRALTDLI